MGCKYVEMIDGNIGLNGTPIPISKVVIKLNSYLTGESYSSYVCPFCGSDNIGEWIDKSLGEGKYIEFYTCKVCGGNAPKSIYRQRVR